MRIRLGTILSDRVLKYFGHIMCCKNIDKTIMEDKVYSKRLRGRWINPAKMDQIKTDWRTPSRDRISGVG